MKTTQLTPKRILLEFPTQKEMTLSMFRFSEFYEGEEGIKGCKFSFDEFVEKYSDEKGNLDYFGYWEGYNIPNSSIDDFLVLYNPNVDPEAPELSKREKEVLTAIKYLDDDGYLFCR